MDIKNIKITSVSDVHRIDYPDFVDAFIEEAEWKDTGLYLSEEELNELNDEYPELINEYIHENLLWI